MLIACCLRPAIRELRLEDIPSAASLLSDAFAPPDGYNPLQRRIIVAETEAGLAARLGKSLVLVAERDDGEIIGSVEALTEELGALRVKIERLRAAEAAAVDVAAPPRGANSCCGRAAGRVAAASRGCNASGFARVTEQTLSLSHRVRRKGSHEEAASASRSARRLSPANAL